MTDNAREAPIAVPMACAHCGQPVLLTYRRGAYPQPISWSCPYAGCQRPQTIQLAGTIVSVRAREEDNADHRSRERSTLEL